ncbi:MAG: hypothetical protein ABIH42_00675 [Planctomycetota bacterium]
MKKLLLISIGVYILIYCGCCNNQHCSAPASSPPAITEEQPREEIIEESKEKHYGHYEPVLPDN